jgi:hypothetical protein
MNLKGIASLAIAIAIVVGFILWIPALKYFLLGALIIGVIVVFILRAYYARKPIKDGDEGRVRLHLND